MVSAKASGSDGVRLFDPASAARGPVKELGPGADLGRAIEQRELDLLWQPIVSLEDGRITACEALVQWKRPDGPTVPAQEAARLAAAAGLAGELAKWTVREACLGNRWLQYEGLRPIRVWVRLESIERPELFTAIKRILYETGLDPRWLQLGLPERAVAAEPEILPGIFTEAHRIGVPVTLDGFGKGRRPVKFLKRLPLDALRIERSLIEEIGENPLSGELVESSINMARHMSVSVVAPGVERPIQLRFLSAHGCDSVQGSLICRPVRAVEIARLLRTDRSLIDWDAHGLRPHKGAASSAPLRSSGELEAPPPRLLV